MAEATRGTFRGDLAVVLAGCVVASVWFRGPFFGLLGVVMVAPPALVLVLFMRLAGSRGFTAVAAGLLAAVATAWLLLAPPSAAKVFERHLQCRLPDDVRDVRQWSDCWGIDPGYYFRFRAGPASVERIIADIPLREVPPPVGTTGLFFIPPRAWWQPGELRTPRVWRGQVGDWHVELWHGADSDVVYMSVYTI